MKHEYGSLCGGWIMMDGFILRLILVGTYINPKSFQEVRGQACWTLNNLRGPKSYRDVIHDAGKGCLTFRRLLSPLVIDIVTRYWPPMYLSTQSIPVSTVWRRPNMNCPVLAYGTDVLLLVNTYQVRMYLCAYMYPCDMNTWFKHEEVRYRESSRLRRSRVWNGIYQPVRHWYQIAYGGHNIYLSRTYLHAKRDLPSANPLPTVVTYDKEQAGGTAPEKKITWVLDEYIQKITLFERLRSDSGSLENEGKTPIWSGYPSTLCVSFHNSNRLQQATAPERQIRRVLDEYRKQSEESDLWIR